MNNSFLDADELVKIGLKSYGTDVLISRKASFYSPGEISLGNNVRIDDFCILSGDITIGSHVHISAYSSLYGRGGIRMEDYTGLSPRCTVFSAMDDFSGEYLIGPMVDESKTLVILGLVHIKKYVQIGAGSIIFPSIIIEEGVAVGAMSLVKQNLEAWSIYAGIPARKIKERENKLLLKADEKHKSMVSVCMITYNQESYIEEAIESVLMQKTNFPIELVIGEDCSTDRTREICMQYRENHPDIIKLRLPEKNMGMMPNFIENLKACTGKYIAICEGDDYWTDPCKLQTQVDILEANEEYSFCFHNAENHYCDTGLSRHFNLKLKTGIYTTKDLLLKGWIIPTASLLFRKKCLPNPMPEWYYSVISGDYALELLLSIHGPFFYMDEIMCVYRRNSISSQSLNGAKPVLYQIKLLYLYTSFFKNHYKRNSFYARCILLRARYDLFKVKIYAHYPIVEELKNKFLHRQ